MSLWDTELLGETKIDNIDLIASFADGHEEVVRLDDAMNEILRMRYSIRDIWHEKHPKQIEDTN